MGFIGNLISANGKKTKKHLQAIFTINGNRKKRQKPSLTSGENTSGNENTEPEVSAPQMGDENHMLLILLTGIGALVVAMMLQRRMKNAK